MEEVKDGIDDHLATIYDCDGGDEDAQSLNNNVLYIPDSDLKSVQCAVTVYSRLMERIMPVYRLTKGNEFQRRQEWSK